MREKRKVLVTARPTERRSGGVAGSPDVHFVQSGSPIMTLALQSHDLRLGERIDEETKRRSDKKRSL